MPGIVISSGPALRRVNDVVKLTATLVKNGDPVTGKTPYVKLVRRSDNKFYNFNLNVWQVGSISAALTESVIVSGVYERTFNHGSADVDNEDDYLAIFTGNGAIADKFFATSEYSFREILKTGDEVTLDAVTISAIRNAIVTHVVGGNILGITLENSLDLIRKILNNRLELQDGSTDNWELYDDDDSTVLLRYDVTDKLGAAISIEPATPARRTRGQ